MQYVKELVSEAAEHVKTLRRRLLKSFKPGMSPEQVEQTNKQLDALKFAVEAIERMTPMRMIEKNICPFCERNIKNISEAAEVTLYCCPYCGQALKIESED